MVLTSCNRQAMVTTTTIADNCLGISRRSPRRADHAAKVADKTCDHPLKTDKLARLRGEKATDTSYSAIPAGCQSTELSL
jgi:hypothetical protein